jgi:aminoglycoside phosphotransferase (APT) family kinase protein
MLAAVAASAVPGLEAVSVAAAPFPGDDLDVAVIADRDGAHWTVQVPRTQGAETRQAADVFALTALTPGARARLPFDLPGVAGQAPVRPTRAVVLSWCPGAPASLGTIPTEPNGLGWMIGRAIAAIHDLPSTVVTDVGLPVSGPAESRRWATSLAERAAATGLLPAAVQARWEAAVDDPELWQFEPTVIGGDLDAGSFLVDGGALASVTGWHGLAIGDPAADLAWAVPAEHVADAVFSGYASIAGQSDRRLRHRAALRSELGLARWLLHGTEQRDTAVVDDAVEMLTTLAERIHGDMTARIQPTTRPILTVDEVEDMLDRRPAV